MPTNRCGRCESVLEDGDVRCALCGLAATRAVAVRRAEVDVLRCRGCGASVSYAIEAQAPKCAFCATVMQVERSTDPIESAEHGLPFHVDEERARQALQKWLGAKSFFRPSDLAQAATLEAMQPIHWAGWTFEAQALVSFAADVGTSGTRSGWTPRSGQASHSFERIVVSASRGLRNDEANALVSGYALQTAIPIASLPQTTTVERFDVQRSAARRIVTSVIERAAADAIARSGRLGPRFRNLHVSVLLESLVTRRLGFPAYVLAYRYEDEVHRVIVHGQDPNRILGTMPTDWHKVVFVIVVVLAWLLFCYGVLVLG